MGRYYFWLRLKAAPCLCGENDLRNRIHHRDTENTEDAQRLAPILATKPLNC